MPSACLAQLTEHGGIIEEAHPWLQEQRYAAEKIFERAVPELLSELKGVRCAKSYVYLPAAEDFAEALAEVKAAAGVGWEVREIKQLLPKMRNCCEVQSSRVNKADGLKELCKLEGIPLEQVQVCEAVNILNDVISYTFCGTIRCNYIYVCICMCKEVC